MGCLLGFLLPNSGLKISKEALLHSHYYLLMSTEKEEIISYKSGKGEVPICLEEGWKSSE